MTKLVADDITRQIEIEQLILDDLIMKGTGTTAEITAAETCRVRIALLKRVIETPTEPVDRVSASPSAALDRIAAHFDRNTLSPYRTYRGRAPDGTPTLPRDIRIALQFLAVKDIFAGKVPELCPRFHA